MYKKWLSLRYTVSAVGKNCWHILSCWCSSDAWPVLYHHGTPFIASTGWNNDNHWIMPNLPKLLGLYHWSQATWSIQMAFIWQHLSSCSIWSKCTCKFNNMFDVLLLHVLLMYVIQDFDAYISQNLLRSSADEDAIVTVHLILYTDDLSGNIGARNGTSAITGAYSLLGCLDMWTASCLTSTWPHLIFTFCINTRNGRAYRRWTSQSQEWRPLGVWCCPSAECLDYCSSPTLHLW